MKTKIFVPALKGQSFFQTMTDQLTTVSPYSYSLACPVYRNIKQLLQKPTANTTVELVCKTLSAVIENRDLMEANKNSPNKRGRRSPQSFCVSVLYFAVVDCCAVLGNGIDKQEKRVE